MFLQALAIYLQGLLLIPLMNVEVNTPQTVNGPEQTRISQRDESQRMFDLAEQFRRNGLFEMAYNCFREVVRLSPNTELAQSALEQMNDLETIARRPTGIAVGWSRNAPSMAERETGIAPATYVEGRQPNLYDEASDIQSVRNAFQKAKTELKNGNLQHAYRLFQKIHLQAPQSHYGLQAVDYMHDIDQEKRKPGAGKNQIQRIQHILNTTVPIEVNLDEPVQEPKVVFPAIFEPQNSQPGANYGSILPTVFEAATTGADFLRPTGYRAQGQPLNTSSDVFENENGSRRISEHINAIDPTP